jgi:hypothetical protein
MMKGLVLRISAEEEGQMARRMWGTWKRSSYNSVLGLIGSVCLADSPTHFMKPEQLRWHAQTSLRLWQLHQKAEEKIVRETRHLPKSITVGDFLKLVKTGKVKPKKAAMNEKANRNMSLYSLFELGALPMSPDIMNIDEKARKLRLEALEAAHTEAQDKLMLGDVQGALAAIEAFASQKF